MYYLLVLFEKAFFIPFLYTYMLFFLLVAKFHFLIMRVKEKQSSHPLCKFQDSIRFVQPTKKVLNNLSKISNL